MRGHILHALAVDPDLAPVADTLEILVAGQRSSALGDAVNGHGDDLPGA
jgi:hypothetical protein